MALTVFDNNTEIAHTHALIIGVGAYPYIEMFKRDEEFQDRTFSTLRELTSAVVSAVSFYRTIVSIDNNEGWLAPLGSIELLLSVPSNNRTVLEDFQYSDPTREAIEEAYMRWKRRCESHPDNIAVFYFCGHGCSNGDDFLFASDFFKNPNRPEAHAFNLQKTVRGFQSCKANRKFFFIDACRKVNADVLTADFRPHGLDGVNYLGELHGCFLQQSTGPGSAAFGKEHDVSYYTQALISALSGQACDDNNGDGWHIDTTALVKAVNQILERILNPERARGFQPDFDIRQYCGQSFVRSFRFITYNEAPEVLVEVETRPLDCLCDTALSCYKIDPDELVCDRAPDNSKWSFFVPAGIYSIFGKTLNAPLLTGRQVFSARPPITSPKLKLNEL